MREKPAELIVVGTGIAGLYAALCAAAETDVVVLSKGALVSSASYLAQGGVAAALGPGDSPELHARDTVQAGRGLCRTRAVEVLTRDAPARIIDLLDLGVELEDEPGREGGHSVARVYHSDGAATGREIARVLAERVREHPRIRVVEGERVLGLWRSDGRCVGVVTDQRARSGRATLLTTGGAAALWERTTNPAGAIGDGILLAYRAGAAVADLEFVQFHPTALAGSSLLLSEALRGAGALLLDDQGERFTDELAPRDVVARAIDAHGTALLDLRPIERTRFSSLMAQIEEAGYNPGGEPIPVAPAAHYTMGGIVTDLDGRTELEGLYAAGECAATGAHGGNRLASNSLLECLVFGRRAALASLDERGLPPTLAEPDAPVRAQPVTPELRRAFWREAGLIRDAAGLERLRREPHLLARLVATSALVREESRGAHFRADFPAESPQLSGHVVLRPGDEPVLERWS
jgi:L-aspartate oxidase